MVSTRELTNAIAQGGRQVATDGETQARCWVVLLQMSLLDSVKLAAAIRESFGLLTLRQLERFC